MGILKRFFGRQSEAFGHPVRASALVVEDVEDESEMICHLLRMQGVIVTSASSIAGALATVNGPDRFQLAFVDLNLKDGSGIEVVRRIRECRRMTHTIIVSGAVEKIAWAASYGYVGVIMKPYSINAIREILSKHRLLPFGD